MNSSILEIVFHPFFAIGLIIIIGLSTLWIIYKDIIELNKSICPICEELTTRQNPHNFIRNGKVYRVHRGSCAHQFLFGDLFGEEIKDG